MPLLLALDEAKQYDCCFTFDPEKQVWQLRFEERVPKAPDTTTGARSTIASDRVLDGAASGVRGGGT